jgi:S-adenosylmethionine:tRNA-ribosyltransferase-isomerase (queuine synthetase)
MKQKHVIIHAKSLGRRAHACALVDFTEELLAKLHAKDKLAAVKTNIITSYTFLALYIFYND